jgi:hypothetical protein
MDIRENLEQLLKDKQNLNERPTNELVVQLFLQLLNATPSVSQLNALAVKVEQLESRPKLPKVTARGIIAANGYYAIDRLQLYGLEPSVSTATITSTLEAALDTGRASLRIQHVELHKQPNGRTKAVFTFPPCGRGLIFKCAEDIRKLLGPQSGIADYLTPEGFERRKQLDDTYKECRAKNLRPTWRDGAELFVRPLSYDGKPGKPIPYTTYVSEVGSDGGGAGGGPQSDDGAEADGDAGTAAQTGTPAKSRAADEEPGGASMPRQQACSTPPPPPRFASQDGARGRERSTPHSSSQKPAKAVKYGAIPLNTAASGASTAAANKPAPGDPRQPPPQGTYASAVASDAPASPASGAGRGLGRSFGAGRSGGSGRGNRDDRDNGSNRGPGSGGHGSDSGGRGSGRGACDVGSGSGGGGDHPVSNGDSGAGGTAHGPPNLAPKN